MKILLTNDDGIHAPGLRALWQALAPQHEVGLVAPESEQSAVGHAITLQSPLRVRKVYDNGNFLGYGVNGTPADCVKIGVSELVGTRPDLVVSGINLGPNVGINVLYSGTVSAATEGAILGIPSVAVSLATHKKAVFTEAAEFVVGLIFRLKWENFPRQTLLNINIPALSKARIKGVKFTRQAICAPQECFDRRIDPRENVYYWLSGQSQECTSDPDVDSAALDAGFITITPLHYDLTHYEVLKQLCSSAVIDSDQSTCSWENMFPGSAASD